MIRAIVSNGAIKPLEPLPTDWQNGHELVVDEVRDLPPESSREIEKWLNEMKSLTAELNDGQEWQAIEAALVEADSQQKNRIRREMGLN